MNKKVTALEKASEKLGTIALDVFEWFKGNHNENNKHRNKRNSDLSFYYLLITLVFTIYYSIILSHNS